jgi:pimeloyl-ACP methyl ester carboxylesterase
LWDATVDALKARHRCVRLTLPGFDPALAPRGTTLAQMTATLQRVVDAVSPDAPVTLVLHDWGCIFGYEYAMQHPPACGPHRGRGHRRPQQRCLPAVTWRQAEVPDLCLPVLAGHRLETGRLVARAGQPDDAMDGARHALPHRFRQASAGR